MIACPMCGDVTDTIVDMRHQGIFACRCGKDPRVRWALTPDDVKFLRGSRIGIDDVGRREEAA